MKKYYFRKTLVSIIKNTEKMANAEARDFIKSKAIALGVNFNSLMQEVSIVWHEQQWSKEKSRVKYS